MMKNIRIFLLIPFLAVAHADVITAEKNFRQEFEKVNSSTKFSESPFEEFYLSQSSTGRFIFTEDIAFSGFVDTWEIKEKGKIKSLPAGPAKTMLRQRIKTDWMIPIKIGSSTQKVIIISAPDCPVCKTLDSDLRKFGSQLDASIFIVPMTLASKVDGEDPFTRAALCGNNPLKTWDEAMTRKSIQKSDKNCLKSDWASVVISHTFDHTKDGRTYIKTPAIIHSDGSVVYGWDQNMKLDSIKLKLGII